MTHKTLWPLLAALTIAGCSPSAFSTKADLEAARIALSRNFCVGSADPSCRFVNSPVQLTGDAVRLPGRSAKFFRTANRLSFTDGGNSQWIASSATLTDGASIPRLFIPIVGSPTDPAFINAAAVHDAHCGIGNENGPDFHDRTWEDTHRMFYDALRVGGTAELKAKIMFAAVYLGGPRWEAPGRDLTGVPAEAMTGLMRETRSYVRAKNPTVPEIETFIRVRERSLIQLISKDDENRADKEPRSAPPNDEVEDIMDEYEDEIDTGSDLPDGGEESPEDDPTVPGDVGSDLPGGGEDSPSSPGDMPSVPGDGPTTSPGDGITSPGGCDDLSSDECGLI